MTGKLFLIPTVIAEGQNSTIPVSVREAIMSTQSFIVENVRTARRYISSLKLGVVIEELEFEVLDKKTNDTQVSTMLDGLLKGKNIGILSESGCPGVADPGAKAVEWAHKRGVEVVPMFGPSSILLGLMGSGFNGQKFCFHGYLPIDKKELEKELRRLESESRKLNQTQIFIETPYRNNQMLEMLIRVSNNETRVCVAKDLTSPDQLIKTKKVSAWKKESIDLHKIPTVFLMYAGR